MNQHDNLKMFYDEEADVLYVTKGHPQYTDYIEYGDNMILRFHPETNELVGFTITDFAVLFKKRDGDFQLPLRVSFEVEENILSGSRKLKSASDSVAY